MTAECGRVSPLKTIAQYTQINHTDDNMNVSVNKILFTYFCYSVAVILLGLFIAFGPLKHGTNTPLQWYDYLGMLNNFLVPTAVYGLFAPLPILRMKKDRVEKSVYFSGAVFIGILLFIILFLEGAFVNVDCGNNCAVDAPSNSGVVIIIILGFFFILMLPIVLNILFKKALLSRNGLLNRGIKS